MKITYHENPDEAVRQQCVELEAIRKKEGQKTYFHLVKELIKRDPWFTMRVVLEWAWLDEKLVGHSFIKHIADHWGEDIGILFPRGHGKTLPMSAIIITAIVNNPNTAVLEISRTEDNANKFGELVSQYLMYNDYLQQCFGRAHNKDGFLPSSISECTSWGKDGYRLPWTKPRLDPTLLCIPLKGAKAGKHPDWIYIDDPTEEENNHEIGWAQVEKMVDGGKFLLPADGFFAWTGTRWHDSDPLGRVVEGKLRGKQGPFKLVQFSCYEDDNVSKDPIYPRKKRWNMTTETGYTKELLDQMRKPKNEGGLGEFFDAQMRNDPAPAERALIKLNDIVIYKDDEQPKLGHVRAFGIEVTGGGLPIFNGFRDHLDEMRFFLPLQEINNPKRVGIEKRDRIVAALQPLTVTGRLYAKKWMIGDGSDKEHLGYEMKRLGKASHDDIIDALHNVPVHLARGLVPVGPEEPAHLYISVDLAWTEKQMSDWTVAMAVAVDHRNHHWIIDYDRFQISSPTGIYDRLIKFYRKFEESQTIRQLSNRKYPGAWR